MGVFAGPPQNPLIALRLHSVRQAQTASEEALAIFAPNHGTPAMILTHTLAQRIVDWVTFRWRTSESNDSIPYTHHGYAYALSNPINLIDPQGTSPWRPNDAEGFYIESLISMAFIAGNPQKRQAQFGIPGASEEFPNNPDIEGYADLLDYKTGYYYDIKSRLGLYTKYGLPDARDQIARYATFLIKASQLQGTEYYRALPDSGSWQRGTSFLTTETILGLWPYGLDPDYNPPTSGSYFVVKAKLKEPGIIEYWGAPVSLDRARVWAQIYDPRAVLDSWENTYQDWRKEKARREGKVPAAQPYPGLVPAPIPFTQDWVLEQLFSGIGCLLQSLGQVGQTLSGSQGSMTPPELVPPVLIP